ncbi:MAG: fatty acid desaturase [Hyphomicrobiaceae bacterium]|nr:fatty acid desaturase [Hyphomicrobiaceae bacterium]
MSTAQAQMQAVDHAGFTAAPDRATRSDEIRQLKARDNTTNFYYLAFVYLVVATTIALALWSFDAVAAAGLGWWWNIPAAFLAVVAIGASQHQLGGAIHEGTHYMLFDDRRLNELASDWLAAFPIYTSTYAFRLHHLAHHQFVNDPERDPNFDQAKDSGHWLDFPIAHIDLLIAIVKQLNPARLVSYIVARARYSALGVDTNPYADPSRKGTPWAIRVGVLFAVGMPFVLVPIIAAGRYGGLPMGTMTSIALVVLLASALAVAAYYWRLPETSYPQSRINPVISHKSTALGRIGFLTIVYAALTITEYVSGAPVWGYFSLFWILPLFSTFPLFMILREWLQHGNADRGRYTNSRIFLVNPFARYAIFPWGMDYHLPHHLFASVPHYKLKALHRFLLKDPEYAEKGLVVEGWSHKKAAGHPTIVDVLGPEYTPSGNKVHVDDATLENADVNDAAAIARHAAESARQSPASN